MPVIYLEKEGIRCENCIFAEWNDYINGYYCHRYPSELKMPHSDIRDSHGGVYEFRIVSPTDYCGEFVNKKTGESMMEIIAEAKG